MKIYSLRPRRRSTGEGILHCPQCKAVWHSFDDQEFESCKCVQFIWSSSELGNAEIVYPSDLNKEEFERAYRKEHRNIYQDDEIPDERLESPDPCVLEQMSFPGVDEVLFVPKIPDTSSLDASAFCVGIAHKRQDGDTRKRNAFKRRHSGFSPARQARAPEWAKPFLGKEFDVGAALSAGWIDQNSPNAHFGVPAGPGIWLYKIGMDDQGAHCAMGRVWWRFLMIRLSGLQTIRVIYTSVVELFADGRGEFCTHDLLPHDIHEGRIVLKAVTADAPSADN